MSVRYLQQCNGAQRLYGSWYFGVELARMTGKKAVLHRVSQCFFWLFRLADRTRLIRAKNEGDSGVVPMFRLHGRAGMMS